VSVTKWPSKNPFSWTAAAQFAAFFEAVLVVRVVQRSLPG